MFVALKEDLEGGAPIFRSEAEWAISHPYSIINWLRHVARCHRMGLCYLLFISTTNLTNLTNFFWWNTFWFGWWTLKTRFRDSSDKWKRLYSLCKMNKGISFFEEYYKLVCISSSNITNTDSIKLFKISVISVVSVWLYNNTPNGLSVMSARI